MNIHLFVTILSMFLIVYLFHNRDVFGPSSIVCGVFVFCSYIAIYSSQRLNLNLSFKAYSLLVCGISSISITSILISVFYKLNYKNTNFFLETNITYIKIYNRKLIISICSILFLISLISQIKLALSISGGSLSNLIYAYRMEMLSGTERIPSIVSNMETVNYAISPNRSASWMIIVFAFAMSSPVSMIVVDTSTSISPLIKSYMISSSSRSLICPCAKDTLAPGTSF